MISTLAIITWKIVMFSLGIKNLIKEDVALGGITMKVLFAMHAALRRRHATAACPSKWTLYQSQEQQRN